jgi:hypothetical protein
VRCLATEPTFSHWPPHLPEAFRRDRVIDLQDLTSDLRSSSTTTTTTHERQLPTSRHFLRPPDGSGDGGSVVKVMKQQEID